MFDRAAFPKLSTYTPRSAQTPRYNCIAWAAGEYHRWWCPQVGYYWPTDASRAPTIEAYIEAFAAVGYVECDLSEIAGPPFEQGISRIALYALNGIPKHAARQIDAKTWTSKMGRNIDLEHTLNAVEGPAYGTVVRILKKVLVQQAAK